MSIFTLDGHRKSSRALQDSSTKQTNSKENIELKVVTMLVRDTNSVSDMDMDSPGEEAVAV